MSKMSNDFPADYDQSTLDDDAEYQAWLDRRDEDTREAMDAMTASDPSFIYDVVRS